MSKTTGAPRTAASLVQGFALALGESIECETSFALHSLAQILAGAVTRCGVTAWHNQDSLLNMGKAKKTRKFAEVKRVLNPKQLKCA